MAKKKTSPAQRKGPQGCLKSGDLTLDLEKRCTSKKGRNPVRLTPKECALLTAFMRNGGEVLSREFLMKEVWDTDYLGDTRTLDVHICWLRRKIEKNPRRPVYLRTVRGVGYRFEVPE